MGNYSYPDPNIDRTTYIYMNMRRHWDYLLENTAYKVIYLGIQGSQNYNLDYYNDNYKSDIDTKAIIVPTLKEIALNSTPISKTIILPNNEHIDVKDIRLMMDNFKKQNINFLEILFTKYSNVNGLYITEIEELRDLAEEISHYDYNTTLNSIAGMSKEKKKALCHPYPTIKEKIEKYGYDGKQLHHIIRLNDFIKAYVKGLSYSECLVTYHDSDLLRKAKLNKFSLEDALSLSEYYDNNTYEIKEKYYNEDIIKNRVTEEKMNDLQYRIIKKAIEIELSKDKSNIE